MLGHWARRSGAADGASGRKAKSPKLALCGRMRAGLGHFDLLLHAFALTSGGPWSPASSLAGAVV
jgi:hypothetical protein